MSSSPTAEGRPPTRVAVGRVGRAHGVTGEVSVAALTDEPTRRLAPGAELGADLPSGGTRSLVVATARPHADRWLLRFDGVPDRTAAEQLGGAVLTAFVAADETAGEGEFFDHQLVGARALDPSGTALGTVTDVLHHAAQDLLVVAPAAGGEAVLVPFVAAIVPAVDVTARTITVDPPGGLFPGPAQ